MIRLLQRWEDHQPGATLRAGGTDVTVRRRLGLLPGDLDDLRDVPGLDRVEAGRLGAKVTLAALATDPSLAAWPLIPRAAAAIATPQVRAVATLGGNLFQAVRCAEHRDPTVPCLRRGDASCAARGTFHGFAAVVDAPCLAPHPSTMALALSAYDVAAEVSGRTRTFDELLSGLAPGEVLTHLTLPAPVPERATLRRVTHRAQGEWPLVEVVARRTDAGWTLFAGGIAAAPRRLTAVEAALAAGHTPGPAATRAGEGITPVPQTAWKLTVLVGLVHDAIQELW